jgi:hypothetical protein
LHGGVHFLFKSRPKLAGGSQVCTNLCVIIEFGKVVFKRGTFEHNLFMKKDKLTHRIILLNVVEYMFASCNKCIYCKRCMG